MDGTSLLIGLGMEAFLLWARGSCAPKTGSGRPFPMYWVSIVHVLLVVELWLWELVTALQLWSTFCLTWQR